MAEIKKKYNFNQSTLPNMRITCVFGEPIKFTASIEFFSQPNVMTCVSSLSNKNSS